MSLIDINACFKEERAFFDFILKMKLFTHLTNQNYLITLTNGALIIVSALNAVQFVSLEEGANCFKERNLASMGLTTSCLTFYLGLDATVYPQFTPIIFPKRM